MASSAPGQATGWIVPKIQARILAMPLVANNPRLASLIAHPAGPMTIHFWAPSAKWAITAANIADLARPPEKLSIPQQVAIFTTGAIWSRYALTITPINYNLMAVNGFMAGSALWHIGRIVKYKMEHPQAPMATHPSTALKEVPPEAE